MLTRPLRAGLPDFLTKVAKVEMQRIPPDLAFAAGAAGEGGEGGGGVLLSVSYIPKVGHAVRMQGPGTRPLCPALEAALPDYSFGFEGETDAGYGAFYFCERTRQARLLRCDIARARLGPEQRRMRSWMRSSATCFTASWTWKARCCAA